jgi:tetratricopeptide (TPR) repeat protein
MRPADAKPIDDEAELASTWSLSLRTLAKAAHDGGDSQKANGLARCAVALARVGGDDGVLSEALLMLSRTEWGMGDRVEQAYAHAQEALSLAPKSTNTALHCEALQNCANIVADAGDIGRASQMCLRVVQISQSTLGLAPNRLVGVAVLNLAVCLARMEVFADAAAAYAESVNIWKELPDSAPPLHLARTGQSSCLASLGEEADSAGDPVAAQRFYAQALEALPPMHMPNWRGFSAGEIWSFPNRAAVLTKTGRMAEARLAVATYLRIARVRRVAMNQFGAALAAGRVCLVEGRWRQAIRYGQRVVAANKEEPYSPWRLDSLKLLAGAHAELCEFDKALAYQREWDAQRASHEPAAAILRCRMAVIERRTERRRLAARESIEHERRLAVIGRLIGQTHHALGAPIDAVHRSCVDAIRSVDAERSAAALAPILHDIVERIERAAALTQQLKLFSYRSAPHSMELSLHRVLQQARDDIDPHIPADSGQAELCVTGERHAEVWADPQRLGILLKVLMIELLSQTERCADGGAAWAIHAHIRQGPAGSVSTLIEGSERGGSDAELSLGAGLCAEIASEMQGALTRQCTEAGLICYLLELPDASQRAGMPLPASLKAFAVSR